MSSSRPSLEGLFNGSASAQPPLNWVNDKEPAEPPSPRPSTAAPASASPFDPVAFVERYFAILQTLLDVQRDVGLRLAHQVAELPGMHSLRR